MTANLFNQLLWPFQSLPDEYVVLDTETTGLFDEEGAPGMVSLGLVMVRNGKPVESEEFLVRPHRCVTDEAARVNGISQEQAETHPSFIEQWPKILTGIEGHLLVIHNAAFDWTLLTDHVKRYSVVQPKVRGVFCSQRAAQPWAQANGVPCSERGPSLDTLSDHLGLENLRHSQNNRHGALIDARQTVSVVIHLKKKSELII